MTKVYKKSDQIHSPSAVKNAHLSLAEAYVRIYFRLVPDLWITAHSSDLFSDLTRQLDSPHLEKQSEIGRQN